MSERIKVSINGGKVYDVELDKALQAMVDIVDKFANEADALRAEVAELREAVESALRSLDAANDPERAIEWLEAVLEKYK